MLLKRPRPLPAQITLPGIDTASIQRFSSTLQRSETKLNAAVARLQGTVTELSDVAAQVNVRLEKRN